MLYHDLKVALAHAKRQAMRLSADVAVLYNRRTHAVIGTATGTSAGGPELGTAIVNLLQNRCEGGQSARDMEIAVTSVPTALCLGMARICQIKRVLYVSNGRVMMRSTASTISAEQPATQGNEYAPATEPPAGWERAPATADLAGWVRGLPAVPGIPDVNGFLEHGCWGPLAARFLPRIETEPMPGLPVQPLQQFADAVFMLLAFAILARLRHVRGEASDRPGGLEGHNIACVLVGPHNRIMGWGINTSELNATHHGEVNCLQNFQQLHGIRAVPDKSRLYTTLEPCWMCSGMIARMTGGRFTILYGQADTQLADTALQAGATGCTMHETHLRYDRLQSWGAQIAAAHEPGTPTTRFLDTEVAAGFFNRALADLDGAFARFVPDTPGAPHLPMHAALVRQATTFLAGVG